MTDRPDECDHPECVAIKLCPKCGKVIDRQKEAFEAMVYEEMIKWDAEESK